MDRKEKIYVLDLQGGYKYVGQTSNMAQRFIDHLNGKGAVWTSLHKPVDILLVAEMKSPHDEQNLTIEMMIKHGIDVVRGGRYSSPDLSAEDRLSAQRDIWQLQGACFRCGSKNHLAVNCNHLFIASVPPSSSISVSSPHRVISRVKKTCSRCGYFGHTKKTCHVHPDKFKR